MLESSSVEIDVLFAKIEAKYFSDIPITSTLTSTINCLPFPVIALSPIVPPITNFVQAANDDMNLHQSAGENVKRTNTSYFTEFSQSNVVLRVNHPQKNQPKNPVSLITRQLNSHAQTPEDDTNRNTVFVS